MDLRLFYFYVTIYSVKCGPEKLQMKILFTQSSFTEASPETKRLPYEKHIASNFFKKLQYVVNADRRKIDQKLVN